MMESVRWGEVESVVETVEDEVSLEVEGRESKFEVSLRDSLGKGRRGRRVKY